MENQAQTTQPDNKLNNVDEEYELSYWSREFGISREELMKAIKSGRSLAQAVEKYVKKAALAI